jgi:hypothetical protein
VGLLTVGLARNHVCSPLSPYILEETETEILQVNLLLLSEWKLIFITAKIKKNYKQNNSQIQEDIHVYSQVKNE